MRNNKKAKSNKHAMSANISMQQGPIAVPCKTSRTQLLAPRERDVLKLLSAGRSYKQIASDLNLSMGTIRTYIRRLYGKIHVNCRTDAVVKYITHQVDL